MSAQVEELPGMPERRRFDGEDVQEVAFKLTGVTKIATDAELDYNENVDFSGNGKVIAKSFDARTGKLVYVIQTLEAEIGG